MEATAPEQEPAGRWPLAPWTRPNRRINLGWPGLEDTPSGGYFVKETLSFPLFEPAVHYVISKVRFLGSEDVIGWLSSNGAF
jgi:hypothetical protein